LALHHGKSATNQLSQYVDLETVGDEGRSGAAMLSCVGKQFECTLLFCAELMFLIQNDHRTFPPTNTSRRSGLVLDALDPNLELIQLK
jgi:hypothetical protein